MLLDPFQLGDLTLNNRVAMAPMTRARAGEARLANALMAEYYAQRASAGLILSEATAVDPMGVGYPDTPGIWAEEQVAAWQTVTTAVHAAGGRIFLQLWHVGRMSHPDFHNGELPLSASALNPMSKSYTPKGFKETVTPKINFEPGAWNFFWV